MAGKSEGAAATRLTRGDKRKALWSPRGRRWAAPARMCPLRCGLNFTFVQAAGAPARGTSVAGETAATK